MITIKSPVSAYVIRCSKKCNYEYLLHTSNCQKKECIHNFLEGTNYTWKKAKSFGWECVKIEISFTLIQTEIR